jgi:hypothetical protein
VITDFVNIKIAGEGDPMSLVNQFQISLKDYLPTDPTERSLRTELTAHDHYSQQSALCQLRAYADESRLPLDPVVEQLREEIHHTSAPEPEGQGFSPRAARRSASQSLRQGREDAVSAAASWFKPTDP